MIATEEDRQAVGWTDMRVFREWLAKAPAVVRVMATLYPPSVYRMVCADGEVLRVVPREYTVNAAGEMYINVVAEMRLNPEYPGMTTHKINDVPMGKLTPIKWPPDARVH